MLNIVFLALAAALVVRFLRTGGPAMLRMMGAPAGHTAGGEDHDGGAMGGMHQEHHGEGPEIRAAATGHAAPGGHER